MNADTASRLLPRQLLRQISDKKQCFGSRAWRTALIGFSFGGMFGVLPAHSGSYIEDACKMMQTRSSWHSSATAASQKWQIPIPSMLAIIRQESRFKATAAARRSSAYGFAQALDGTWNAYRRATKSPAADRSSFADSVDFIAWYMTETRKRIGLPPEDVASHYIAYHEGHGGYQSTRWQEKQQIITQPDASTRPKLKPFGLSQVVAIAPRPKPLDRYVAALNSAPWTRRAMTRLH